MKTLDDYSIEKKVVLLRVDLNVPVAKGKITEKSRIESIKLTIKKLRDNQNKIFLLSHFGRPKGKEDIKYSLKFLCDTLEKEFKMNSIYFLENFDSISIKENINKMNFGDVCLFENVRFYPEEEENNLDFVKKLSINFDVYVNDAFSASHRNHASIVGFPNFLPSIAGYSLINEIKNLENFINNKKKPNFAIIGGSKISSKINLLNNLIKFCDYLFIGGAMANTFLYAKDYNVGNSLCEKELSETAISILRKANNSNCKIILPLDVICSKDLNDKNYLSCDINKIPSDTMILDIGPQTTKTISKYIYKSNMILWNGPLGAFEYEPYEKGSIEVANILKSYVKLSKIPCIAGGGDTIAAIKMAKALDGFTYISKAGGAFLEWLEGNGSPGVNALKKNKIT